MLRIGLNALLLFGLILGTGQARGQLVPVSLDYRRVGDQLVLSWTNDAFSLQAAPSMHGVFTNLQGATSPHTNALSGTQGYFRLLGADAPAGMALIPAGSFTMGDTFNEGWTEERPTHTVYVSAFYCDRYEVTKALWDEVYQWAITHGYSFNNSGLGKAANHPVHTINWYDAVKWCNARSEREGRVPAYYTSAAQTTVYRTGQINVENDWVKWNAGYRLPTEAEWEKAARGGSSGQRFPWGNTITHSQANYYADPSRYTYDVNSSAGFHPTFATGNYPYTSPVGYFAANGYGLYDMAGNVWEWCWDWYQSNWYSQPGATQNDTRGPTGTLSYRVLRGGNWFVSADFTRCAACGYYNPDVRDGGFGFRCVRGL